MGEALRSAQGGRTGVKTNASPRTRGISVRATLAGARQLSVGCEVTRTDTGPWLLLGAERTGIRGRRDSACQLVGRMERDGPTALETQLSERLDDVESEVGESWALIMV